MISKITTSKKNILLILLSILSFGNTLEARSLSISNPDQVTVYSNSNNNVIDVLANDNGTSNSYFLIISQFHLTAPTNQGGVINLIDNGTETRTDDKIAYTPPTGFIGIDTFQYLFKEGATETYVTVTINIINDTPTAVDDVSTVDFGSTDNVIDVLANDSFGSDGAINGGLTMTNGTLNSASTNGGLISIDNKGTLDTTDDEFNYSAPVGFNGTDTFNYTITDASGDASTATVTVTVNPESNDPAVVDDYYTIEKNSSNFVFNPTSNDNKGNNSVGQMFVQIPNIYDQPFVNQMGTLTLLDNNTPNDTSDDSLSFTPAPDFTGVYEFHYLCSVGESGNNFTQVGYGYVYITVSEVIVNQEITAINDVITVDFESTDKAISILDNDTYGTEGPTTAHEPLSLVNGKQNTATLNGGLISVSDNGTINDKTDDVVLYTAPSGFSGTDSFTYSITDAGGNAATATVTITVNPESTDTPTAVDDAVSVDVNSTDNVIDVLANDSFGSDGTYVENGITDLFLNLSAGLITQGFFITTDNTDNGGTAVIIPGQEIRYTPAANFQGVDTFDYWIYDGSGDRSRGIVTVTVGAVTPPSNDTPTAVDDTATVDFGSTNNVIDVLANDSFGSDGAINGGLTMTNGTLNSASTNGGLISIDNKGTLDTSDDEFNYSAPVGFSGTDTFNYTITDASGDASTATVTVTVNPDAPLAGPVDDFVTVAENSTDNVIDVMANDNLGVNGYGRMLIFSVDHLSAATTEGGLITLIDGGTPGDRTDDKIAYTPPANFTGIDTFYYYLQVDGIEYQTIGVDAGMVTVTIGNVTPPATTPTAVADAITVDFESTANVISVLANDSYGSDGPTSAHAPLTLVNGKTSTATLNGGLISVSDNGTTGDNTDDVVLYSAPTGFSGTDSFTYSITDATGDAATATVTITVNAEVTSPAVDDAVSVDENSSNNVIDVMANDIQSTSNSHGAINLKDLQDLATTTTSQGGTIAILDNGTTTKTDDKIAYTPPANFTGVDTFDYSILVYSTTLGAGQGTIYTATVTVTVGAVTPPSNDTPTAVDDTATVDFGSTNNVIDVLANDSFGSDGAIDGGLTMTNGTLNSASTNGGLISIDNKGTLDATDDEFNYSAPVGFSGTDTFNYTITDASGDASTATVTVTVNPVAPLEGAVDDTVSVDENSTDNVIDVLANDNFGTVGVGRMLINSANHLTGTTSQGGTLTLDDGGTSGINQSDDKILYTPPANFTGVDTFDYTLTVGSNQYQGTVIITVGIVTPPTSDTPTAVDDTVNISRTGTGSDQDPIFIDVLLNDSFGSDGAMTAHNALSLRNGKLSEASNGGRLIRVNDNGTPTDYSDDRIQYFPSGNSSFTSDSFVYTITDNTGDATTATVNITYTNVSSSKVNENSFGLNNNTFTTYPNPSRGNVKTALLSSVDTKATMYLFDVTGKLLQNKKLNLNKGINNLDFNFSIKSGIVFMKIISSEVDFGTSKIIIR
ncbi:Ig-like domain-containing protein [Polaribacter porphyrae]|uniref:Secretion system C-terminal sorting domain-containing protein n=1 Tax=Polaribacter porphyrae TaxID=1137780 RepID=A0A2S7WPQ9_9FLAO|nr:Ig-like domain-containing protein [Polaribacter porphyrae]PQJ79563.1 hypothetical protein BTO18_10445 [Polaribacter porphyrae]